MLVVLKDLVFRWTFCVILMSKYSSSLTNIVLTYRALKNISQLDLSDSRVFSWTTLTQFLPNSYKADLGLVKTSHHLCLRTDGAVCQIDIQKVKNQQMHRSLTASSLVSRTESWCQPTSTRSLPEVL